MVIVHGAKHHPRVTIVARAGLPERYGRVMVDLLHDDRPACPGCERPIKTPDLSLDCYVDRTKEEGGSLKPGSNPTLGLSTKPQPPATDAAVLQWDEILWALYLAELREQHGALPN